MKKNLLFAVMFVCCAAAFAQAPAVWPEFNGVWYCIDGDNPAFTINNDRFDLTLPNGTVVNCEIQIWKEIDLSFLVLNPLGQRPTKDYIHGYSVTMKQVGGKSVVTYTFLFHKDKKYMLFLPENDLDTIITYAKK
jgi:hypothetical protein